MKYTSIRRETQRKMTERKVPEFVPNHDAKGWARILKARHEAGEKLSPVQISMYREALRLKEE